MSSRQSSRRRRGRNGRRSRRLNADLYESDSDDMGHTDTRQRLSPDSQWQEIRFRHYLRMRMRRGLQTRHAHWLDKDGKHVSLAERIVRFKLGQMENPDQSDNCQGERARSLQSLLEQYKHHREQESSLAETLIGEISHVKSELHEDENLQSFVQHGKRPSVDISLGDSASNINIKAKLHGTEGLIPPQSRSSSSPHSTTNKSASDQVIISPLGKSREMTMNELPKMDPKQQSLKSDVEKNAIVSVAQNIEHLNEVSPNENSQENIQLIGPKNVENEKPQLGTRRTGIPQIHIPKQEFAEEENTCNAISQTENSQFDILQKQRSKFENQQRSAPETHTPELRTESPLGDSPGTIPVISQRSHSSKSDLQAPNKDLHNVHRIPLSVLDHRHPHTQTLMKGESVNPNPEPQGHPNPHESTNNNDSREEIDSGISLIPQMSGKQAKNGLIQDVLKATDRTYQLLAYNPGRSHTLPELTNTRTFAIIARDFQADQQTIFSNRKEEDGRDNNIVDEYMKKEVGVNTEQTCGEQDKLKTSDTQAHPGPSGMSLTKDPDATQNEEKSKLDATLCQQWPSDHVQDPVSTSHASTRVHFPEISSTIQLSGMSYQRTQHVKNTTGTAFLPDIFANLKSQKQHNGFSSVDPFQTRDERIMNLYHRLRTSAAFDQSTTDLAFALSRSNGRTDLHIEWGVIDTRVRENSFRRTKYTSSKKAVRSMYSVDNTKLVLPEIGDRPKDLKVYSPLVPNDKVTRNEISTQADILIAQRTAQHVRGNKSTSQKPLPFLYFRDVTLSRFASLAEQEDIVQQYLTAKPQEKRYTEKKKKKSVKNKHKQSVRKTS